MSQIFGGGWWYNSHTGMAEKPNPLQAIAGHLGLGWHFYNTQAEMLAAIKANGWPGPFYGGKGNPTGVTGQITGEIGGTAAAATGLTGLAAVGDFFSRLTQKNTWVRVGEVTVGGILLIAGLRALTSGSPAVGSGARKAAARPVRRAAKGTAKVVVPEVRLATRVTAKRAAPKTTARVAAHRQQVRKYGARRPA